MVGLAECAGPADERRVTPASRRAQRSLHYAARHCGQRKPEFRVLACAGRGPALPVLSFLE